MPKTTRLTGPSKADGTQTAPLDQRAVDLEFTGPNADLTVGGHLTVGGDVTIAGEPLTFLVADEPTEVDLDTVGDVTTLALTDSIARNAVEHAPGQYYPNALSTISAQTLTLSQLVLSPVWLSAGTIDRLSVDVSTGNATGVIRVGIYTHNAGLPSTLVAEGTDAGGGDGYPLDAATNGAKTAAISATIPVNGTYWLALVNQTAQVSVNGPASYGSNPIPLPLGTSPITGTTNYFSRVQASVTGALPATLSSLNANPQAVRFRMLFRYAA